MYYPLFLLLTALWIIDLVQTLRFSRQKGVDAERNPFARFLLKKSRADFVLFKMLDLLLLGIIMALLRTDHGQLAESMLISFIGLYAITVLHNRAVQKRYKQ